MFTGQAILIRSILDLPDPPALVANATYKETQIWHLIKALEH